MTGKEDFQALQDLKAWFAEHPECSDPAAGIRALGLPDMTGVPADPCARSRSRTLQRMAAEATAMLRHAEYAIRQRNASVGP